MMTAAAVGSAFIIGIGVLMLVDGEDPGVTISASLIGGCLFGAVAFWLWRYLHRNRVAFDGVECVIYVFQGGTAQTVSFSDVVVAIPAKPQWPYPNQVTYQLRNGSKLAGPMQHQGMYVRPRALTSFTEMLDDFDIAYVLDS